MVSNQHKIIVIKANKPSSNDRGLPILTYHVLGTENVNHALLCASTSSVGDYHPPNGNIIPLYHTMLLLYTCTVDDDDPFNKNGTNTFYNHHCLEIEHDEPFHIAVDGHTFAIIKEHYPQLFNRVSIDGNDDYCHYNVVIVASLWYHICTYVSQSESITGN